MGTTLWLWVFWRVKQDGGHLLVRTTEWTCPAALMPSNRPIFRGSILGITMMSITILITVLRTLFLVIAID